MTPTIEPTPEQFARVAGSTDDTPVVMLNLLRFKERADGIDAADGISGAEAYARYAAGTAPFLAEAGGEVLYAGGAAETVIGPEAGEWHLVAVVRYPSRAAFAAMVTNPEYLKVHEHRIAALADSRLIATTPVEA